MLEVFIAKLFGLYLIIMGVLVLTKKKSVMPAVMDLVKNRALTIVLGTLSLVAGLAVVLAFQDVSMTPTGLISLIGYMMVVEGIIYLALPVKSVQKMVRSFGNKQWFMVSGIVAVLAGIYLAGFGFGLF
ncbi:MAG: hypothetical protein KA104_01170 [Candidatus Pacebacteria bacterium]|nr:hypothetical protein [Candidatus Paceibacterota bacterium]